MKNTISLSIPEDTKVLVKDGQSVSEGTLLCQKHAGCQEVIDLANIFKVVPEKIKKFLEKKEGEAVAIGDIIARKRSLLTQTFVKSPIAGKISDINTYRGTVTIVGEQEEIKISSPVVGKVNEVGKGKITLEFSGRFFEATSGKGKSQGHLISFREKSLLDALDISSDVFGKIILGANISQSGIAKAEVLEANGMILGESPGNSCLPFLVFAKETLAKVGEFSGNMVILDGEAKRLIVPFT